MKLKLAFFPLLILVISCKTYTITPENFHEQIIIANNFNLERAEINDSLSSNITSYNAINLDYLTVNDKNGKNFQLPNSPSVEIRITLNNGKRKIFYLDTVTLENDTLKGLKSKILGLKNKVPFNNIVKIEVQDGHKNFNQYKDKPTEEDIILDKSHYVFNTRGEILEDFEFSLDSVSLIGNKYENIFYAKCLFKKSNTELKIIYYKIDNSLKLITINENSPYEMEISWINHFFLKDKKIFHIKSFGLKKEKSINEETYDYKDFKFNNNLDIEFLKKFTLQVYDKIEKSLY